MDFSNVLLSSSTLITDLILIFITALGAYLVKKFIPAIFTALASKLTNDSESALAQITRNAVLHLGDVIKDSVIAVELTTKKGILEASKDGKLTKDEIKLLNKQVIDTVKETIPKQTLELASNYINDIDGYIVTKAEGVLGEIKGQIK